MQTLTHAEELSNLTLGGDYPYWHCPQDAAVEWTLFADEAVKAIPVEERWLDPVAVLSMLCFGYICLDRTLIKGLNRVPWFGIVGPSGNVSYEPAPAHGNKETDPGRLGQMLLEKLREEVAQMCNGHDRIWCLLSGGLDSRVVAGVIRELQRSGDVSGEVHSVTWGREQCRDVVYARRMADHFGWEWHHVPMSTEDYWQNFRRSAEYLGAEVSPAHVHRMDWFSQVPRGDLVIAASYGDSVGRAEYSSTHLTALRGLRPFERYEILAPGLLGELLPQLKRDILALRQRHGDRSETGWFEIEQQAHYMRRLIAHVLGLINRWCSIQQAMVSPSVFSVMWAHSPRVRTNAVYAELLERLDPPLLDIPWARTGLPFRDRVSSQPDSLPKDFHEYGLWLKRDHADKLEELLFGSGLEKLKVFDMNQLHWMFREWKSLDVREYAGLADKLTWIATLAEFVRMYHVGSDQRVGGRIFGIPVHFARKAFCRTLQFRRRILKRN